MEYFIEAPQQNLQTVNIDQLFARFYNLMGTLHADKGKLKDAIKYYDKAIELNPFFSAAYFNRGTIKADIGNFEGAKYDFGKAREFELNFGSDLNISKFLLKQESLQD